MPSRPRLPGFKIAGAVDYKGKEIKSDYLIAEDKLDGNRMIVIIIGGEPKAYTRSGIEIPNAKYVLRELENKERLWNCVLDGEAVVLDKDGKVKFEATSSVCNTQSKHPDAKNLHYRVFDYLSLIQWESKKCLTPLVERKKILLKLFAHHKGKRVSITKFAVIEATPAAMSKFMEECISRGLEGGMYKLIMSFYSFRKNNDWLKMKPYKEADFKIVGMKPGKKGKTGQMFGLIGSLQVVGKVAGVKVKFYSSGMNMKLRKKLTELHKKRKLVGKIIEARHEGLTVKNKVRFPRFKRLRTDKEQV